MRKLIIDENTIYELDEKCMVIKEVSDNNAYENLKSEKEKEKTKDK